MAKRRVFVTVGTTKFDKLISTVLKRDVLYKLQQLGYNEILIQTGESDVETVKIPGMIVTNVKYIKNFTDEIEVSDLVISHAGAGTCLEVLNRRKPLIVVVNDKLMDNHQMELAQQLQKDGYLFCCTCDGLEEVLNRNFVQLLPYPKINNTFGLYLDKCMGFI